MPPVNYSQYKKVMPPGGIAAVPTEPVYMDPAIKGRAERAADISRAALSELEPAALAQVESMKAAREPWSSYIGRTAADIGSNVYNTVANASLYDMGKGIVTGAVDAATLPGDALTGKQVVINPDGTPNQRAIERSFDTAGMVTLGSGAVPKRGMELRSGMGHNGGPELPKKPPNPSNPEGSVRLAAIGPDGYYLKSEDLMQKNPQKSGTAGEFLNFLKNKGVKKHELEFLGVDRLDPRMKMTREQFITELNKNVPEYGTLDNTEFAGYSVPGGENYRMRNITWANAPDTPGGRNSHFNYDTHYLPDNTLLHNRYKDMVDPDTGQKVLRVEEVQSDWAQQGREKGFKGGWKASPDMITTFQTTVGDIKDRKFQPDGEKLEYYTLNDLNDEVFWNLEDGGNLTAAQDTPITVYKVKSSDPNSNDAWAVLKSPGHYTSEQIFNSAKASHADLLKQGYEPTHYTDMAEMLFAQEQKGLNHGPLVTENNMWVGLSIKDSLREAAKGGQTQIVVMPGEIHAKRWAGGGPDTQKGLMGFYKDVYGKAAVETVKDIKKDYAELGVPKEVLDKVQVRLENKSWIKPENSSGGRQPETHSYAWARDEPTDVLAQRIGLDYLDSDSQQARLGDALDYLEEADMRRGGTGEALSGTFFDTKVERINTNLEAYEASLAKYQGEIDMYMEKLNKIRAGQPDALNQASSYQSAIDYARDEMSYINGQIPYYRSKLLAVEDARKLASYWNDKVRNKTFKGQGMTALVIDLPPEMHDYINKNGFSKFAKGGIVTLDAGAYL